MRVESSGGLGLTGAFCRQLVGLVCLFALASGCDFSPVLDIPLPEHEPGLVLQSVLVADSTVTAVIGLSRDPYERELSTEYSWQTIIDAAIIELVQGGQVIDVLTRSLCTDIEGYVPPDGSTGDERCGAHRSTARIEAGGTYTLRVRSVGVPEASATVTVPARIDVSEVTAVDDRRVSLQILDPAGEPQHYALQLSEVQQTFRSTYTVCDDDGTMCRDTTVVETLSYPGRFNTRDPFLLAAARQPGTESLDVITFDDQTFDGEERAFTIEPLSGIIFIGESGEAQPAPVGGGAVWLIAIDERLYDAYQGTYFSLGDDNPFEEPSNLPSNVIGGYGLVGAATIHARELSEPPAGRPNL